LCNGLTCVSIYLHHIDLELHKLVVHVGQTKVGHIVHDDAVLLWQPHQLAAEIHDEDGVLLNLHTERECVCVSERYIAMPQDAQMAQHQQAHLLHIGFTCFVISHSNIRDNATEFIVLP
jgi:hypothetical protein